MDGSLEEYRLLLGSKVVIIEGLNLSEVDPGEYQMVALPLKIKSATVARPEGFCLRKNSDSEGDK